MSQVQNSASRHDRLIRQQIATSLSQFRRNGLREVCVEVKNRSVVLKGFVGSAMERQLAVSTARRNTEVSDVVDKLVLRTARPLVATIAGSRFNGILERLAKIPQTAIAAALLLLIGTVIFVGCGETNEVRVRVFPVSGSVTMGGTPLANAFVVFHPKAQRDAGIPLARATTDASGKFQISSYEPGDGAVPGEYAVTIEYYAPIEEGGSVVPGPNILNPKLAKPETTNIFVTVTDAGAELSPFDVSK